MIKLSITAFVMGLALSLMVFTSVKAQTMAPSPTPVVPTSAPSTGHGMK